jgi:shikimate kinase
MSSPDRLIPLLEEGPFRPIFLWGMMGAGKSTALAWLQQHMGLRGLDTDEVIQGRFRTPLATLIREQGEDWFRLQEHHLMEEFLLNPPDVIATGGGLPLHFGHDRRMLDLGEVIFLHAEVDELARRLASGRTERPLLDPFGEDLISGLQSILEKRLPVYRQAHWTLWTGPDSHWLPALGGWAQHRSSL